MNLREQYLWYAQHLDELRADKIGAIEIPENAPIDLLLREQSALFLHWADLEAQAEYEADKAKELLDKTLIPAARNLILEQCRKAGEKRPSEARLDTDIYNNKEVVDGSRKVTDLRYIQSLFRNARQAVFERKACLVSINSRECIELRN